MNLRTLPRRKLWSVGPESTLSELHASALDREPDAWPLLIQRLKGVAWWALSSLGLSTEDRKDAFAATFARLFERLDTIREPEKLPGWVSLTATREGYAVSRRSSKYVPTLAVESRPDPQGENDEQLLDDELLESVRAGFEQLPEGCRQLLRLLTVVPPLSYQEIAEILDRPQGSLGPSRARCLDLLRKKLVPYLADGEA